MNVGVIVARFQVPELHDGHIALINAVKQKSDLTVVLLGVSPVDGQTLENPLTFSQRRTVVQREYPSMTVLPLVDAPTAEEWTAKLDSLLASLFPFDAVTIYRGRPKDAEVFRTLYHTQYPVVGVGLDVPVSGTDCRMAIEESSETLFMRGQIFALKRQFPHPYLTVDIALVRGDVTNPEVLLIQRRDIREWGFPGGFVDVTDDTIESAARRELLEETGLSSEGRAELVSGRRIDDWRYRGRDTIMTTFWYLPYTFGHVTPNNDEVYDYAWCPVSTAVGLPPFRGIRNGENGCIAPVHAQLYRDLTLHMQHKQIMARNESSAVDLDRKDGYASIT